MVGAVVAAARRSTVLVASRSPAWRCQPPAKPTSLSIVQSWMVTTSGHGRMIGVNVGYGTYSTAAPAARISRASSRQRCTAPSVISVLTTSACAGRSDSGKSWARPGLTSTRRARPSSPCPMDAASFITERAIPCAPRRAFTRASMRIER